MKPGFCYVAERVGPGRAVTEVQPGGVDAAMLQPERALPPLVRRDIRRLRGHGRPPDPASGGETP